MLGLRVSAMRVYHNRGLSCLNPERTLEPPRWKPCFSAHPVLCGSIPEVPRAAARVSGSRSKAAVGVIT